MRCERDCFHEYCRSGGDAEELGRSVAGLGDGEADVPAYVGGGTQPSDSGGAVEVIEFIWKCSEFLKQFTFSFTTLFN